MENGNSNNVSASPLQSLVMRFLAIKKWKDGGEQTIEYFATKEECLAWIQKQRQPKDDSWQWCVGEYA